MLKLRRARECFGVRLHACWSLLVPGTGSGEARGCEEETDDGPAVEGTLTGCALMLAASVTLIWNNKDRN